MDTQDRDLITVVEVDDNICIMSQRRRRRLLIMYNYPYTKVLVTTNTCTASTNYGLRDAVHIIETVRREAIRSHYLLYRFHLVKVSLRIGQETGWKERLKNDPFYVE